MATLPLLLLSILLSSPILSHNPNPSSAYEELRLCSLPIGLLPADSYLASYSSSPRPPHHRYRRHPRVRLLLLGSIDAIRPMGLRSESLSSPHHHHFEIVAMTKLLYPPRRCVLCCVGRAPAITGR